MDFLSSPPPTQTDSGAHPASYPVLFFFKKGSRTQWPKIRSERVGVSYTNAKKKYPRIVFRCLPSQKYPCSYPIGIGTLPWGVKWRSCATSSGSSHLYII